MEIQQLQERGIELEKRLFISPYAHVIFLYHQRLDQLQEKIDAPIGTTERGIGPCYEDVAARSGIRVGEWIDPEVFKKRLSTTLAEKNRLFQLYGEQILDYDVLYEEYSEYAKRLQGFVFPFEDTLNRQIRQGKRVLFEGAQGALLDVHFGTYPFVTSSSTSSAGLAVGAGVGPGSIGKDNRCHESLYNTCGEWPIPHRILSRGAQAVCSTRSGPRVWDHNGKKETDRLA